MLYKMLCNMICGNNVSDGLYGGVGNVVLDCEGTMFYFKLVGDLGFRLTDI